MNNVPPRKRGERQVPEILTYASAGLDSRSSLRTIVTLAACFTALAVAALPGLASYRKTGWRTRNDDVPICAVRSGGALGIQIELYRTHVGHYPQALAELID